MVENERWGKQVNEEHMHSDLMSRFPLSPHRPWLRLTTTSTFTVEEL